MSGTAAAICDPDRREVPAAEASILSLNGRSGELLKPGRVG